MKRCIIIILLSITLAGCTLAKVEELERKVEWLSLYVFDLEDKIEHQIQNILYRDEIEAIKHKYAEDIRLIKEYLYDGKDRFGEDCFDFCDKYAIYKSLKDKEHVYPVLNISYGKKFYLQVKDGKVHIYELRVKEINFKQKLRTLSLKAE